MAGIYLHIPFCKRKCAYCDFYSIANTSNQEKFIEALLHEIEIRKNYLGNETIQTIYFGGGTPSLLSPKNLEHILESIDKNFNIEKNREITLEANPDDLSVQYLKEIQNIGINRLSVGIQSFFDEDLNLMKRQHSSKQAKEVIKQAQETGFKNISVDLIYGLPNLSIEKWEQNINEAINLKIQHISAYHLTIEPNTLFQKYYQNDKINLPTDEESLKQFELLKQETAKNGFIHYEISNFALDGSISLHNTNYWLGVKYLGLGPSAHSYNLSAREWNISNLHEYMDAIFQGKLANETEILTENEKFNEFVMTSLRTKWGLNTEKLKIKFGLQAEKYFLSKTKNLIEKDLLTNEQNNYILTEKGMFISDNIIASILMV